jgi:hypothetical protein
MEHAEPTLPRLNSIRVGWLFGCPSEHQVYLLALVACVCSETTVRRLFVSWKPAGSLEGASTLLGLRLLLRLVCLRKCGRFHEPEPSYRDQLEPCARAVRYSIGRAAVCTHRQQSPRVSAARVRIVWTHLNGSRLGSQPCYRISRLTYLVLLLSLSIKTSLPNHGVIILPFHAI